MYCYKIRPGHRTNQLLIEFNPPKADAVFFDKIMTLLKEIKTEVKNVEDLWMNDETLINCESEYGKFLISRDVWDLVFIMSEENQRVINKIGDLLSSDEHFQTTN